MSRPFDVVIAGAGIVGLAHAFAFARRGLSVAVVERRPKAQGASVRNFGMIWPVGQPGGPLYDLARRSRDIWLEVLPAAGLWHARCGSLHLAYHDDEAAVLEEFAEEARGDGRPGEIIPPAEIVARSRPVNPTGLRLAWWSPDEVAVDPRQVVADLPAWLSNEFGVQFHFDTTVQGFDGATVRTTGGPICARRLLACTGVDFRELAPEAFAHSGIVPCKLQMLRTPPRPDLAVGPMLAAGLTLRHYKAFANCPSLPALAERFDREMPDYHRWGIHVMAAQNGLGELVLGDSHEYGDAIDPFDKPELDALILAYLARFLVIPDLTIAARWHGIYAKHPSEPWVERAIGERARAVSGVGGHGMTMSFGLADSVVERWLREES